MKTKLSVIIVTYNQENKITKCLNSLLHSNTKDIELIVADDCSTDETEKIVRNWLGNNGSLFKGFNYLRNAENKGTVVNITNAISSSCGEYIKLIAGDDWFLEGALDLIKDFIETTDFDIAFSKVICVLENNTGEITFEDENPEYDNLEHFFELTPVEQFNFLAIRNRLPAPAAFFSRAFWDTIRLSNYQLKYIEDWAMWLLGSLKKSKFVFFDKALVIYLKHENSVTRKPTSKIYRQYLKDIVSTYRNIVLENKKALYFKNLFKVYLFFSLTKIACLLPLGFARTCMRIKNFALRKK